MEWFTLYSFELHSYDLVLCDFQGFGWLVIVRDLYKDGVFVA